MRATRTLSCRGSIGILLVTMVLVGGTSTAAAATPQVLDAPQVTVPASIIEGMPEAKQSALRLDARDAGVRLGVQYYVASHDGESCFYAVDSSGVAGTCGDTDALASGAQPLLLVVHDFAMGRMRVATIAGGAISQVEIGGVVSDVGDGLVVYEGPVGGVEVAYLSGASVVRSESLASAKGSSAQDEEESFADATYGASWDFLELSGGSKNVTFYEGPAGGGADLRSTSFSRKSATWAWVSKNAFEEVYFANSNGQWNTQAAAYGYVYLSRTPRHQYAGCKIRESGGSFSLKCQYFFYNP